MVLMLNWFLSFSIYCLIRWGGYSIEKVLIFLWFMSLCKISFVLIVLLILILLVISRWIIGRCSVISSGIS